MTTTIKTTSEITVRKIQDMGGDAAVVAAMMVSSSGEECLEILKKPAEELNGRIRYLMQHRHGTPFEHSALTMFVNAPIFVWREWHRHRIGFSYNEESGRYKKLEPVFYIPPRDRPMVKVENWKPGRPKFMTLDEYFKQFDSSPDGSWGKSMANTEYAKICRRLQASYEQNYAAYEEGLKSDTGFSNITIELDPGLARDCLPVGIYSSCWVTCNPRSLMAFLSLRTHEPEAKFPSYPLYEIEVAARAAEQILATGWPITYRAFQDFGRVAP